MNTIDLKSWKIKKIDDEVNAILATYGIRREDLTTTKIAVNRSDKKRMIELLEMKIKLQENTK